MQLVNGVQEMGSLEGQDPSAADASVHVSVLRREVVELLAGDAARRASLSGWIVDGTLGVGGHAELLLRECPGVSVLGVDQDPEILALARGRLSAFESRVRTRHARASEIAGILEEEGLPPPRGMLLDLGVSSLQLDRPERGFAFQADGPLDMRMDPTRPRTAAEIVNHWDEADLADLFFHEGGDRRARRIARAIVEARRRQPFLRTGALADLIARVAPSSGKTHPATRAFQALRRAVNEEGEELIAALAAAESCLDDGARLAVISFHSGEDGVVKRFFARGARLGAWRILTKKPVVPAREEQRANRRSRSAALRVAERVRGGEKASTAEVHA
ncbi:MAG TPA: 16S rRNA (cytosine(1402)-N(4))-methyltransferase RsmH [Planctomycetota bacterium]|nr:16S rRNA (cytosine(1402)-N(4))-methyltransferase RsmH [Planctomycetota bacterium]